MTSEGKEAKKEQNEQHTSMSSSSSSTSEEMPISTDEWKQPTHSTHRDARGRGRRDGFRGRGGRRREAGRNDNAIKEILADHKAQTAAKQDVKEEKIEELPKPPFRIEPIDERLPILTISRPCLTEVNPGTDRCCDWVKRKTYNIGILAARCLTLSLWRPAWAVPAPKLSVLHKTWTPLYSTVRPYEMRSSKPSYLQGTDTYYDCRNIVTCVVTEDVMIAKTSTTGVKRHDVEKITCYRKVSPTLVHLLLSSRDIYDYSAAWRKQMTEQAMKEWSVNLAAEDHNIRRDSAEFAGDMAYAELMRRRVAPSISGQISERRLDFQRRAFVDSAIAEIGSWGTGPSDEFKCPTL